MDSNAEVDNIRIRLRNLEGTVSELGMKVEIVHRLLVTSNIFSKIRMNV
jgi:hypothetical protein